LNVEPPQVLLQTSVQLSRDLKDISRFSEVVLKAETLRNDIIIAFSLSLVANSFCTGELGRLKRKEKSLPSCCLIGMIIFKVLWNSRAVKRAGARSFTRPAIHLLLESAAICCACLIITLTLILLNNSGTDFILEVTPMIFVRTAFAFSVTCSRMSSRA
jgi:hypothetical protein